MISRDVEFDNRLNPFFSSEASKGAKMNNENRTSEECVKFFAFFFTKSSSVDST